MEHKSVAIMRWWAIEVNLPICPGFLNLKKGRLYPSIAFYENKQQKMAIIFRSSAA